MYASAGFLTLYGLRSLIAGYNNEKKAYWMSFGYNQGMKRLLKDKYDKVNNLILGGISFLSGIIILIVYRP